MTQSSVIVVPPDDRSDQPVSSDTIRDLLNEGMTVQVIAAKLQIDPGRVMATADQNKAVARLEADNGEKLRDYLGMLDEIIDLAHWQAKAEPTPFNIGSFTQAVETARGIMQDLDNRRDDAKLTEELVARVLEPCIKETVMIMVSKLAKARADIKQLCGDHGHTEVDHQIDDVLRTLASTLNDQLTAAKEMVPLVLADNVGDQKPQVKTKKPKPGGR